MGDPIRVTVEPGVCGFLCDVCARREGRWSVGLEIRSECKHIKSMGQRLTTIAMKGLFAPITSNPVYRAAESAGCHASCPVPLAVIKAAEVAMDMAVARDVRILFDLAGQRG
ncbi:MAG: hypothetical protein WHX93_17735 [bacterium]